MVPGLRNLTQRLKHQSLSTLDQRRRSQDTIAVYKALTGMENVDKEDLLIEVTRKLKIQDRKKKKRISLEKIWSTQR